MTKLQFYSCFLQDIHKLLVGTHIVIAMEIENITMNY